MQNLFIKLENKYICYRCRHGYFHVVNNDYTHWEMYAIGGSANPTINSQGNRFVAPDDRSSKEVSVRFNYLIKFTLSTKFGEELITNNKLIWQVTKHEDAPQSEWKNWNWRSEGDLMMNGAFFTPSGAGASSSYAKASSLGARPSSLVGAITMGAGTLNCRKGSRCQPVRRIVTSRRRRNVQIFFFYPNFF